MNSIAFAVIVLVVLGLAGGIILVLASKFMAVYEDPRIAQITECLAGANCGGCGYAGCADYAKAIVENGAPTNKCAPGGAKATEAVNAIMGTESASGPALHAVVNCNGGNGNCGTRFEYHGIPTCAAAAAIALFGQVHVCDRHDAVCGAWHVCPSCLPAHSLSSSL